MAEGESGGTQIARLEKGASDRTARHADVMNEIIDRLNAIANTKVIFTAPDSPTAPPSGKFITSDANEVLELKIASSSIPIPPTTGTHVLGVIENVIQWIETDECTEDEA